MEIVIAGDAQQAARTVAERIAAVARSSPHPVLGVATGSSPQGAYRELAAQVGAGLLDLSRASAFALDEYVGLPADHEQSYTATIRRTVTEPLHLDPARVHVPDGRAADLVAACERYERMIRDAGGVDVQVLGIGENGHIGFNEPSSGLGSRTRVTTLTESTRRANARFFDDLDEVPAHAVTQGLGTIGEARQVVLVALGARKAEAVAGMVDGPVSARCPASVLQLHPRCTVVLDEDAASRLADVDHHRQVQR